MNYIKVIALLLTPAIALWAGVGFAVWDWNPGNWSASARAWSALISTGFGLGLFLSALGAGELK
jgi:hypothetical protein